MFIEFEPDPPAAPSSQDSSIVWKPGSTWAGASEGPTLQPHVDEFQKDSLQGPIWPGGAIAPQVHALHATCHCDTRRPTHAHLLLCILY